MRKLITLILLLSTVLSLAQTPNDKVQSAEDAKMQWFANAKLGIFIHWGIYAVNGISESWSFHNGYISYEDYMKQLKGFNAKNYDATQWASLIKESGARYAVLTAKHHDGVALWDSKQGGINVVKNTPSKRDLIKPFADALRKEDIKVGLYFSLLDWSYPDYDKFTRNETRYKNDSVRFNKFLKYCHGQLKELSDNYNPDLFWFDGDWEHNAEEWKAGEIRNLLVNKNPNVILNSRLAGYGDYATPEQGIPIYKPKSKFWELCMTTNDNWGYQQHDTNYKSVNQIINIFVSCISNGGNLLLDIGPKADGTICTEQTNILKGLGRWTKKHSDAIFDTQAGIPIEYTNYPTTLSVDSTRLFVFVNAKPTGPIALKGIKNKINRIHVVGNGTVIKEVVNGKQYWSTVPGIIYINLPDDVQDYDVTVLCILLDGKIQLHNDAQ